MPKLGMEPQRRADVINATLTCISIHGIDGMTLDKVAKYADCSKGVVTYYYKNKDNLTIEAFKSFLAYYGLKIESEIENTMTAGEMIDITLKYYRHTVMIRRRGLMFRSLMELKRCLSRMKIKQGSFYSFSQKPCWIAICRK
jgi:AcrR family transcriptional regulator